MVPYEDDQGWREKEHAGLCGTGEGIPRSCNWVENLYMRKGGGNFTYSL